MSESKTFFTKIFGEEFGGMMSILVGTLLVIIMFNAFPFIIVKIGSSLSNEKKYNDVLSKSREVTRNLYKELSIYDSLTSKIELKIDNELQKEKDLINEKREILIELQKDFDSIYLTPQQMKILSVVAPRKDNISFKEWISSPNQLYNIAVNLIISLIFFYIGRRFGVRASN